MIIHYINLDIIHNPIINHYDIPIFHSYLIADGRGPLHVRRILHRLGTCRQGIPGTMGKPSITGGDLGGYTWEMGC